MTYGGGGWAGWQASWRGTSQPRLTLSITADTDALDGDCPRGGNRQAGDGE